MNIAESGTTPRRKRFTWKIALFLFVAILIGLLAILLFTGGKTRFASKDYPISLVFQQGWLLQKITKDTNPQIVAIAKGQEDGSTINVSVAPQKANGEKFDLDSMDIDELNSCIDASIAIMESRSEVIISWSSYNHDAQGSILTINGKRMIMLESSFTHRITKRKIIYLTWTATDEQYFYAVSALYNEEDAYLRKSIEDTVNTLHIGNIGN